ncbi:MAG TPA: transposase [Anaerolineaceae bacterium]|nr:transposase [Anaerolineaceae bacterium]
MANYILVATPQIAFGELIRISLEEGGNYRVRLVQNSAELLSSASHTDFAMAILDSDLGQDSFISLARTLLEKLPKLRLVVIPPENNPNHPSLSGLIMDGYLSRPFYLPDLIQLIERLLGPPEEITAAKENLEDTQRTVSKAKPFPWILDVSRVDQELAGCLPEISAQAVMVLRSGKIWSHAGKFNQPAWQEMAAAVNHYWDGAAQGDMAHFIHLETDNTDYLSYATCLGENFLLALLYDVNSPLSQMRAQTNRLARIFMIQEPESVFGAPDQQPAADQPVSSEIKSNPARDWFEEPEQPNSLQNPILSGEDDESGLSAEDDLNLQISLANLLADMPSPNPDIETPVNESLWVPEISDLSTLDESSTSEPRFPWEETDGHRLYPRSAAADVPTSPLGAAVMPEYDVSIKSDSTYICILIPNSPQHLLTGQLADKLAVWVPELCSSFGWNLEGLAVRPEYLQWIVRVAPTVSPSGLVRIIRQNTSIRISSLSEKYQINNPEEDFWAPGYLMGRGNQPPAPQLLQSYIERTRRSQGNASPADVPGSVGAASPTGEASPAGPAGEASPDANANP